MKKTSKRVISLVLVILLAMSMTASVMAAGKVTPIKGTQTVYLSSKEVYDYNYVSIALASGTKSFTIKPETVKVKAGTAGAKLEEVRKNKWTTTYREEYRVGSSSKWKKYTSKSTNCSYYADLYVKKAGTATVKYKIGSKSYSTKLKVLAYKNPVKSITLTGVNGGKSFASLTKNQRYPSRNLQFTSNVSSATLKVVPAKGWKITDVTFYAYGDSYYYRDLGCSEGLSSATLKCGKMQLGNSYEVSVECMNTSNGAYMYVWYPIYGDSGE